MFANVRLSRVLPLLLPALALAACGKASEDGGRRTTTFDVEEPSGPSRVTTRKSEWGVGGIVGGKSETTIVDTLPAPPVVVEQPLPKEEAPPPQSGLLTAGDVDDLLNPVHYAGYAGRFLQGGGSDLPFVDTRTRVVVKVTDRQRRPAPFALVEIQRKSDPLRLVTAADGTASFYPRVDRIAPQTRVSVQSRAGTAVQSVDTAKTRVVAVTLAGTAPPVNAMDLVIALDTTGSMGDELSYLTVELQSIVARLKRNAGNLNLRLGVILFRDEGDEYVVRTIPLTSDVAGIRAALAKQDADGGGDQPEAMDQALAAADRLPWRPDAAKALLLVTDAPPHDGDAIATLSAAQRLRAKGIQIVPVAASGVDDQAQYILRTMAALTQGRYIFLTDDSGVGDSHAEPDVACYIVTPLARTVARVLAGIASGRRVEPAPGEIIRTVGNYDRGRCVAQRQ